MSPDKRKKKINEINKNNHQTRTWLQPSDKIIINTLFDYDLIILVLNLFKDWIT